ncbi:class IIb bacteriocin, lactobin A/cerein 7B family [Oceanivirga salmonicida]|uniref:class IIb bacteriocin, lactobin A/cerein 7B family n=1 Tax=Oceanivirga salmonicida TaxID=1769291 RepID=UPI0012E33702|nr:class IIb bacteriocin, lactobin A/cerein 7B family [Oceanivirga salmonicida]
MIKEINEKELMEINGGVAPLIIIGGIAISQKAAIGMGLFGGGVIVGGLVGYFS